MSLPASLSSPAVTGPPGPGRFPAAAAGGLALAAIVWLPLAPGYWIFTANAGLVLACSTIGLMIVVGWAREVSLVQAGLTGTAVYVSAWAFRPGDGLHWPFMAAAGLGVAVVVTLSLMVALATARLSGIYVMVLTLALQVSLERTVFTYPSMTGGGVNASNTPRPAPMGVGLDSDLSFYLFSILVLGALMVLVARLRSSRFGRGLLLVGTDRQAAAAVGVSPWRAKTFAFALAGLCAGVAGALTAPLYTTPPSFIGYTTFQSLFYLAVPVLAGFRSIVGVATVAMLFATVPQALEPYHIPPLTLGAVGLVLGTVVGPGGLSGLVLDKAHAWRKARAGRPSTINARAWTELARGVEVAGREHTHDHALGVLAAYLPGQATEGDVLAVEDVSVAFGGLQALRGVSIQVPAGQLVGLIGPNGAGKTTLFDVMNGLRTPDAGTVELLGRDITRTRAWERAGLGLSRTFQASRLNLALPVSENLLAGAYTMIPGGVAASVMGLRRPREGARRAEEAAWAVAQLFDIDQHWAEPVGVLSFGNRRRVEIGRSLMSGPRLLLLDEPSAGLDPTAANTLFSVIRQLHRDLGLTVLLIEHYVRAVLENCDLVYVLAQGQVVARGAPDEVAAHPDVRSQYLGPDFQARLAAANANAADAPGCANPRERPPVS